MYMLRLLPSYAHSSLIRTRDPSKLEGCHTVVDVGGQYDSSINRYDHHQREFSATFPGRKTKLSSAGLVFMHLGKSVIAQQTGLPESSKEVNQLYEKMYDDFVEAFDANDNGISAYDTTELNKVGVTKRFNDRGFSIASVVNRYNYDHDLTVVAEEIKTAEQMQEEEDQRFLQASAFTGSQFIAELVDTWRAWLPARKAVREAFEARTKYDPEGQILVLSEGIPWQDHLFTIEKDESCQGRTLYALFPENAEPDSKWRIRAVSRSLEGFELRKALPEKWRGLRDDELSSLSGIGGCVFVHASGFIGGNKTFDGALRMAQAALNME